MRRLLALLAPTVWTTPRQELVRREPASPPQPNRLLLPQTDSESPPTGHRNWAIGPNVVDIPYLRSVGILRGSTLDAAITDAHNTIRRSGVNEVLVYCGKEAQAQQGIVLSDSQPMIDALQLAFEDTVQRINQEAKQPVEGHIVREQRKDGVRVYVVYHVLSVIPVSDRVDLEFFDPKHVPS